MSAASPHLRLSAAEKDLVEALAGALGSVTGTWVFYPLDTVKTRLQARRDRQLSCSAVLWPPVVPDFSEHSLTPLDPQAASRGAETEGNSLVAVARHLLRTEGAGALYRGLGYKTVHSVVQSFAYFYAFARLRSAAERRAGAPLGVAATLCAGTAAGWLNVLLTEPLDTVATARQTASLPQPQASSGASVRSAESSSVPPEQAGPPVHGLYRSLWVSLLLTLNPALQFTAFDQARRRLLARRSGGGGGGGGGGRNVELSALDAFLLGAASKALATTLTYPAIRGKVLLQTGRGAPSGGVWETLRAVVLQEGPPGLYRGLSAQLLKTVLVAALQLMVKEKSFGTAYLLVCRVQEARLRAEQRRLNILKDRR